MAWFVMAWFAGAALPGAALNTLTPAEQKAKIQSVKYTARGFRNKQNFITAIYFHCGGLDLAPATK
jgi:hypothetical protein